MLTQEEKNFLDFWEKNRLKQKNIFYQLRFGLPLGLLIGVGILLNFTSGWYERATMVAFSQSTPIILIFAIIIIAVFCAIFYKRHRWEMNEQLYTILSKRKDLENNAESKQQEVPADGQIEKQ